MEFVVPNPSVCIFIPYIISDMDAILSLSYIFLISIRFDVDFCHIRPFVEITLVFERNEVCRQNFTQM